MEWNIQANEEMYYTLYYTVGTVKDKLEKDILMRRTYMTWLCYKKKHAH